VAQSRAESILRAAYTAFNARDVNAALELMHPEVDWPNAWEGGRVIGRKAVAAYWTRQFESISSAVEPERFDHELMAASRSPFTRWSATRTRMSSSPTPTSSTAINWRTT
jgi:hypothetical protein